jgi:tetratricopeptide (TPR) repeat protein
MTKIFQKRVVLSLGIFLLLFLSSCGWLRKEQVQKEQVQKQQVQKQQVQKQQVQKQTDYVDKQVQIELEEGKFQKAIDLCKEIYQKYPQDPTVRSGYIKTLESIKSSGDGAFERNDFKLAGNIYEILVRNWVHFSDFSQSLSFKKNFLENKVKTSRCLFTEEQVSSHIKAGEFRKAIDLCKEIYQKYPQDSTVRSGYIRTLESIKGGGDRAFEKSDFALAGCVYGLLLKNYSSVGGLNGSLSFKREGLTARIRDCKKILFENGLDQYRSGNLNQAISLWRSILVFDPENQEIKKAVDMASLQSKNLQKAK